MFPVSDAILRLWTEIEGCAYTSIIKPNDRNIIKFAKHTGGYANFQDISSNQFNSITSTIPQSFGNGSLIDILGMGIVSTPRTISSHGEDGLKIPITEAQMLRACLREVFPDLAEKPVSSTRLCWQVVLGAFDMRMYH